jgi:hypothetical protein
MSQFITTGVVVTLVVFALLLVGGQDFNDAKRAEAQYCADVRDRVYPDYKGIYQEVCSVERK